METEVEDWGGWTIDLTAPRAVLIVGGTVAAPRRLSAAEVAWLRRHGQEFHENYEQIRVDAELERQAQR